MQTNTQTIVYQLYAVCEHQHKYHHLPRHLHTDIDRQTNELVGDLARSAASPGDSYG